MEKLNEFKIAALGFLASIGTFLGWQGIMALAWVAAMGLDYLTGSAAACKEGKWSSGIARVGLWHKLGMILSVLVSAFADVALEIACDHIPIGLAWPGVILPLVALSPFLGDRGYWFFIIGISVWNAPYLCYTVSWQSYFSDLYPPTNRALPYSRRQMVYNAVPGTWLAWEDVSLKQELVERRAVNKSEEDTPVQPVEGGEEIQTPEQTNE